MKKNKKSSENQEEVKPYKVSFWEKIPFAVKALFVKYWFFAAIYFFIGFGLGEIIYGASGKNDMVNFNLLALILGIAIGIIDDLMVYNILPALESDKKESYYYRFFKSKKFYSFLINIAYGIVLSYLSAVVCANINGCFKDLLIENWVCAEPFTYGAVVTIVDAVLITIRTSVLLLTKKIRHKEI